MRGAIFDLDGTLADTAADLMAAANAALAPHGLPALEIARDKPFAGRGGRSMIRRALALAGRDPDTPEAVALTDALYPGLLAAYEARIAEETRLFEGAEAAIAGLSGLGWRIGVCTNKPERLARLLIDRLGLGGAFGAVLGADSLAVRKPDPEHFRETARRAGADPARSVMIGDTRTDVETARAAGVPVILTRFGFAAEPVDALAPDAMIGHFREIAPALERLSPDRPARAARA